MTHYLLLIYFQGQWMMNLLLHVQEIYTFKAMFKQACLLRGRPKIRLHTAPRPWVIRSPSLSFAWCSRLCILTQRSSSNFNTESGKKGASPRSRLNDLSEAGKESTKAFAYKQRHIFEHFRTIRSKCSSTIKIKYYEAKMYLQEIEETSHKGWQQRKKNAHQNQQCWQFAGGRGHALPIHDPEKEKDD